MIYNYLYKVKTSLFGFSFFGVIQMKRQFNCVVKEKKIRRIPQILQPWVMIYLPACTQNGIIPDLGKNDKQHFIVNLLASTFNKVFM